MINENKCIKIMQISAGWIMGQISDGENEIFFSNSYINNFLENLMLALLYVNGVWAEDEYKNSFRAEQEPASSLWKLSIENELLVINVKTYENYESDNLIDEITVKINSEKFLKDFVCEMKSVLNRFGLYGYRLEWGYEFPLSLFLKLTDVLRKEKILNVSKILADENVGLEADKTEINIEMDLLSKLLN